MIILRWFMKRLIVASLCRKCNFCGRHTVTWISLPLCYSAVTLSQLTAQIFQEWGSCDKETEETKIKKHT